MWVGVGDSFTQNEGSEMYFWGKGTYFMPFPDLGWWPPPRLTEPGSGAPSSQELWTENGTTHWSKIFSAHQPSLLLRLPTQVPHCPGISSHPSHCHLPNLIRSLALCCHQHAGKLAKESSLLSVVSQEAPHSLTSSWTCHLTSLNPAPSPCSLWIPNILHYGFFRRL